MAGFDPFSMVTEVELAFEDTRFKGAVVTCRLDLTAEEQFALFADAEGRPLDKAGQYRVFGERILKSWNLSDRDGVVIPANADGMMRIPAALADQIQLSWSQAVWSPAAPLSQPSSE